MFSISIVHSNSWGNISTTFTQVRVMISGTNDISCPILWCFGPHCTNRSVARRKSGEHASSMYLLNRFFVTRSDVFEVQCGYVSTFSECRLIGLKDSFRRGKGFISHDFLDGAFWFVDLGVWTMSILFYSRPDYTRRSAGTISSSDCAQYVERVKSVSAQLHGWTKSSTYE